MDAQDAQDLGIVNFVLFAVNFLIPYPWLIISIQ